jgi:[acyl-carrier-protein] S-malonyltransferase
MRIAWLFPGQGSQYIGMGRGLFELTASARKIFAQAEELSGLPLREISLNGPAERLRDCAVLEPLLAAISLSYAAFLREQKVDPSCVAGYSAGEVAALYTAGVISLRDALRIATRRGQVLSEAARSLSGKMLAIYRISADVVQEIVTDLGKNGAISVAAWNAPDHTTIVGEEGLLGRVERQVKLLGAEVAAIDVSGPWHSGAAEDTARRIGASLSYGIRFSSPSIPIYMSSTGTLVRDRETIRRCLIEQVYKPVRWNATVCNIVASGVHHFIEVGPGRVLRSFVKRAIPPDVGHDAMFLEGQNGLLFRNTLAKIVSLRTFSKMREPRAETC